MPAQSRRYQTQWACQFLAAAELTRRGYLVSLPFGNARFTDLMVETPNDRHFSVDVKGQSTKSWWIIKPPEPDNDGYFILVYVPQDLKQAPSYYILSSKDMSAELEKSQEKARQLEEKRGKPFSKKFAPGKGGMDWNQLDKYKDRWDILPQ
jgi:hypothetical protein